MNTARVEEQQLIATALQVMVEHKIAVYRHARVELARVPGAEKLRVRMTKEEGDAEVKSPDQGENIPVDAADFEGPAETGTEG